MFVLKLESEMEKISDRNKRLIQKFNKILVNEISNDKLNVGSICQKLHITRPTFNRKIKQITGLTPRAYIEQFKLVHAAKLLLEPDRRVSDVASEVGFSNHAHFSQRFRKQFGTTPSQFGSDNVNLASISFSPSLEEA